MKYILYARKSTEDKDRQILSIEAQVFELKEFAAKEKLEIVSGAAPPPFRIFAGGLPRRLWRRKRFGLIQVFCTKNQRQRRANKDWILWKSINSLHFIKKVSSIL